LQMTIRVHGDEGAECARSACYKGLERQQERGWMRLRQVGVMAVAVLGLGAGALRGQEPKMKESADRRAFAAADAVPEAEARLEALRAFVREYPESGRVGRANERILDLLARLHSDRRGELEAQSALMLARAKEDGERRSTEASIALTLADAYTEPVDLPYAHKLAEDAAGLSREQFIAAAKTDAAKSKQPVLPEELLGKWYSEEKAFLLVAQGAVAMHEGHAAQARAELEEARGLDASEEPPLELEGQMALDAGHKEEALEDWLQARMLGTLVPRREMQLEQLYGQTHGGAAGVHAALEAELDRRYGRLQSGMAWGPEAKHSVPSGGHAVLLELFSGADCAPCVAADLAVERAVETFGRDELVAVVWDEHIPGPDPLTIAAGDARAKEYGIPGTPTTKLDGADLSIYGGREEARTVYERLEAALDKAAAGPDGADVSLQAEPGGAQGVLRVRAAAKVKAGMAAGSERVMHVALVEDNVRYSGGNGVRFHRMVVRALAGGDGFAVGADGKAAGEARFDLAEISREHTEYLTTWEAAHHPDGWVGFASKETQIDPKELGVAAWVEEPGSHRVLGAAFLPVGR
jgi:hypothetical protein